MMQWQAKFALIEPSPANRDERVSILGVDLCQAGKQTPSEASDTSTLTNSSGAIKYYAHQLAGPA